MWKVVRVILVVFGCFFIYEVWTEWEHYHFITSCLRFVFAICFIVIVIAIEILKVGYAKKCPNCKKWFALKECGTEFVREEEISVKVEGNTYNRNRDIIGTQEQYVPGVRKVYHKNYKCKKCGRECYSTFSKDNALI